MTVDSGLWGAGCCPVSYLCNLISPAGLLSMSRPLVEQPAWWQGVGHGTGGWEGKGG